MAVAYAAAAIAVAPPPSSLFLPRPSALASRPFFFSPPRASAALRSSGLLVRITRPSLHRPRLRLAAAAASGAREIAVEEGKYEGGDVKEPDISEGGDGDGSDGKSGGGGHSEEREEEKPDEEEKNKGVKTGEMSMLQKLTLAYAALIGVDGVMVSVKSGSQKPLAAAGMAAFLLLYVSTQLPVKPVFASRLGLGLSAAFLAVKGLRFKKSGKVFPAGVLSLMSLVMVGGYFQGIVRGEHV